MDANKFHYFVAKYRAAEADELLELGARAGTLAEEAEAALRQVASERALALQEEQTIPTPSTALEIEERSYSPARAELINIRKMRLLWSLPSALLAGLVYAGAAASARGSVAAPLVALVGLFGLVWPTYCVYKLSRAIDPKRSVAWAMVAAFFIPIVGWLALISLVKKAGRIRKAVTPSDNTGEANPV